MKAKTVRDTINEGVADKYAERAFGIPDPNREMEAKIKGESRKELEIIGAITNSWDGGTKLPKPVNIVKNPGSLKDFPDGVRGIIGPEGDLYVAAENNVIHWDITDFLSKKKLIPMGMDRSYEDYEKHGVKFVGVHRIGNKDVMGLSESYMFAKEKIDPELKKEQLKKFQPFMDAAHEKNPGIKFANENVWKAAKQLFPEERFNKFAF